MRVVFSFRFDPARFFSLGFVCIVGLQGLVGQLERRPNLLFIMTDQQRFDAMSCAGNTVLETPNMDRIAREGVMFQNAYTANPVCVPSRAVFLTGHSSVSIRVENNRDYNSDDIPDVPTFDSVLKEHGYGAEYYGKWHTSYQFADCYDNEVKVVGKVPGAPGQIAAYQEWLESKGVMPKKPGEGQLLSGRNKRPYTPIELDFHSHVANAGLMKRWR